MEIKYVITAISILIYSAAGALCLYLCVIGIYFWRMNRMTKDLSKRLSESGYDELVPILNKSVESIRRSMFNRKLRKEYSFILMMFNSANLMDNDEDTRLSIDLLLNFNRTLEKSSKGNQVRDYLKQYSSYFGDKSDTKKLINRTIDNKELMMSLNMRDLLPLMDIMNEYENREINFSKFKEKVRGFFNCLYSNRSVFIARNEVVTSSDILNQDVEVTIVDKVDEVDEVDIVDEDTVDSEPVDEDNNLSKVEIIELMDGLMNEWKETKDINLLIEANELSKQLND